MIEQRELTQMAAAKLLGLAQPKVSALRNYKLTGFSVEQSDVDDFWAQLHPRKRCAGELLEWDTEKCPRCKNEVKWT